MSLKSKRICKCCGKEYDYCPHCGTKSDELWKNLADTKECLAVFNIVAAYNVGRATADQVKKVLEENNIKDYSKFNKGIVSVLDKIYKSNDIPKVEPKIVKTSVAEITPEKVEVTAPHLYEVKPEQPMVENAIPHHTEAQGVPRKNRNGKKKYRKRNTDIGL